LVVVEALPAPLSVMVMPLSPLPDSATCPVTPYVTVTVTVVESVAFAAAEPPPNTLTAFTCGDVALAATFTVTVIAG